MEPLLSPDDLLALPGAPFDPDLVDMAAASVRSEAGWHIAPVVTETLTVDSYGGLFLPLPTRRIIDVTAVRDGDGVAVTGWSKMRSGLYFKAYYNACVGWPVGVLEVDLTHGYDIVPAELLPIIAQRVAATAVASNVSQRSVTNGPFSESETYRDQSVSASDPVVARYSVYAGVA